MNTQEFNELLKGVVRNQKPAIDELLGLLASERKQEINDLIMAEKGLSGRQIDYVSSSVAMFIRPDWDNAKAIVLGFANSDDIILKRSVAEMIGLNAAMWGDTAKEVLNTLVAEDPKFIYRFCTKAERNQLYTIAALYQEAADDCGVTYELDGNSYSGFKVDPLSPLDFTLINENGESLAIGPLDLKRINMSEESADRFEAFLYIKIDVNAENFESLFTHPEWKDALSQSMMNHYKDDPWYQDLQETVKMIEDRIADGRLTGPQM